MQFKAVKTVEGRIEAGIVYQGQVVVMPPDPNATKPKNKNEGPDFRIYVFDETGTWAWFHPHIFVPY